MTVKAGVDPKEWNKILLDFNMPPELRTEKEIQQDALPRKKNGQRLTLDEAGDSITQSDDPLCDLYKEVAADESIVLPPDHQLYVDFMAIFAESLPAAQQNATKQFALGVARKRYRFHQPAIEIPAVLGTMAELREQWQRGEIWFRAVEKDGKPVVDADGLPVIVVEYNEPGMPPDEPDDWDENDGGAPSGTWTGLKFTPGKPSRKR